jgi:putative DNA primase/helicase
MIKTKLDDLTMVSDFCRIGDIASCIIEDVRRRMMEINMEINFEEIKENYKRNPLDILRQIISGGKCIGNDYVVINPTRDDKRPGSFRIDIKTGKYNDLATGDSGGDIIDLVKYIRGCTLREAGKWLKENIPSFLEGNKSVIAGNKSAVLEDLPVKEKDSKQNYIWCKSEKSDDHKYLVQKHIGVGNARVNTYCGQKHLVIPLTDSIPDNEDSLRLKGLQFILEDGNKRFYRSFKGLFYIASDCGCTKTMVVICEGYATAQSIAASTGIYTVSAMSAYNLKDTALKIRELLPNSEIIIAADNDEAGIKAAEEAFRALGCNVQIIYPTQGKDFNDMLIKLGADSLNCYILDSIEDGDCL